MLEACHVYPLHDAPTIDDMDVSFDSSEVGFICTEAFLEECGLCQRGVCTQRVHSDMAGDLFVIHGSWLA